MSSLDGPGDHLLKRPATCGKCHAKPCLKDVDGGRIRALGVRLQFVEARDPADFDRAFSDMTKARAGALTLMPNLMFLREHRRLVDLAAKQYLTGQGGARLIVNYHGSVTSPPHETEMRDAASKQRRAS